MNIVIEGILLGMIEKANQKKEAIKELTLRKPEPATKHGQLVLMRKELETEYQYIGFLVAKVVEDEIKK